MLGFWILVHVLLPHVRADERKMNDIISQQQFVACEWGGFATAASTTVPQRVKPRLGTPWKLAPRNYTKRPWQRKVLVADKTNRQRWVRAYAPKMSTLVISNANGRTRPAARPACHQGEHIKWAMHEIMNNGPYCRNMPAAERSRAPTSTAKVARAERTTCSSSSAGARLTAARSTGSSELVG